MDTEFSTERPQIKVGRRQFVVSVLLTLGFAGALYFGAMLRDGEPNYYQPARAALVTARERLDDYFNRQVVLTDQLQSVRGSLDAAIAALGKVRLNPADQRKVESLKSRLRAFEDIEYLEHNSPKQLQQAFREVSNQLTDLIEKLDQSKS